VIYVADRNYVNFNFMNRVFEATESGGSAEERRGVPHRVTGALTEKRRAPPAW